MNNFLNRRVLTTLFLGFSSGLPLFLVGSTLQAWYTVENVSLMTIGLLTLVGQPYLYKFLWAPLFDRYVPFKFLGRRRSWIFVMQVAMAGSLAVMAFLHPNKEPLLLATVAFVAAIFSASQDIAINAYQTDVLHSEERGFGAACMTLGYRIAMLVAGGLALIMAAQWGWRITYLIMAGLIALEILITWWAPIPQQDVTQPETLIKAVIEPFKEFLTRPYAWALLSFIVIYKLSDAMALSLNTTFLIRGVGFSLAEIGAIAKMVSLIAAVLGSLLGGYFLPRWGMYRSLLIFGFLQICTNLLFAVLGIMGKSYWLMASSLFLEYFFGGLSTVVFVAFLMGLCNQKYTATQYAVLSAFSAVGRVIIGPIAAAIVNHVGWVELYVWTFILGFPGLILLWWINKEIKFKYNFVEISG